MKTFSQFISEASPSDDPDLEGLGRSTSFVRSQRGQKIGNERRKTSAEKKRVKAIGGGKTAPAKTYKPRKDIGSQRPKSRKEVQPTRERGSAKLSAKEAQRKAYKERKAKESGAKTKTADELLRKKTTKAVSPKYKAQKASGYSANERRKLQRAGDRLLRDIAKKKEKPAAHYDPEVRKSN